MLALTVALLIVVFSLFYIYCIKPLTYWERKGVKQTKPLWLFGDSFQITFKSMSFPDWIMKLYNTYEGPRYFGMYQFAKPILLIKDLQLIKQITVKDFDHFGDHSTILSEKADPLWANNLFALKGQRWREMRPLLSPFFTSSKMKSMFVLMSDCAKRLSDFFLEKDEEIVEVEFKDVFTRYCNDVIATTAFGIETDSLRDQDNDFYLMGKEATSFNGFMKNLKFMLIVLSPKICEIFKIQFFSKEIKQFFYGLVDETIRVREEKNILRPDMIQLLMQARKGNIKEETETGVADTGFSTVQEVFTGKASHVQLTNQQIASQAMIFFFGGFDSVSTLMCFLAYELAANPDIQERLRDEVEETFKECDGKLTYDAMNKMKYMDMVVSEALRKWPVNLAVDRECTKPYIIEPTRPDEKRVEVAKGDSILIPVYSIHRDEKLYPDPDNFDPERFNDENRRNINPLAYIPFGSGPRNCIGSRFALVENKAVIFHILHNFEIVPTSKSQIPIKISKHAFQLLPDGGFCFGLKRLSSN